MTSREHHPKRANILSSEQEAAVLRHLTTTRYPQRDRVLFLLSLKAGLNANDISELTWAMITHPNGQLSHTLALEGRSASGKGDRQLTMHPTLREALVHLYNQQQPHIDRDQSVIYSERGQGLTAASVALWFHRLYRTLGMDGYSSLSGRRTFITRAVQKVAEVGGSLRDVQQLAGYADLRITQQYVEEEPAAQHKLIRLL